MPACDASRASAPAALRLLLAVLLSLAQRRRAADIYGYVDEQGVAHFAAEKLDERYQLFFRGGESFDTADGLAPLGRRARCRRRRRRRAAADAAGAVRGIAQLQAGQAPPARGRAAHHDIDYELLQALIATESGFDAQRRVAQGRASA